MLKRKAYFLLDSTLSRTCIFCHQPIFSHSVFENHFIFIVKDAYFSRPARLSLRRFVRENLFDGVDVV